MSNAPDPPKTYQDFIARFPKLGEAWEKVNEASAGPLDEQQQRLIKLAVSVGAMREGAVRAGARKSKALGIPRETVDQVTALAAGTLGFPSTVAVFSWIESAWNE